MPVQELTAFEVVRVFDRDPDLLAGVEPRASQVLRDRCVVRCLRLATGPWTPDGAAVRGADGNLGLLVLDGALTRSVHVDVQSSPELVARGDLLRPWDADVETIDADATWRVLMPTRLAILDDRFAAATCRWPTITAELVSRALQRSRSLAFLHAVARVRRAETRLLMLFRHLGERWGKVTPRGVLIPLPLTHELLGDLVCLRRPTVSTALGRLVRENTVERGPDRTWLVRRPEGMTPCRVGSDLSRVSSS